MRVSHNVVCVYHTMLYVCITQCLHTQRLCTSDVTVILYFVMLGLQGLKINNVFSIELVFKAFDISVQEVKPTDLLRHLLRERLQNQDWSVDALPQVCVGVFVCVHVCVCVP